MDIPWISRKWLFQDGYQIECTMIPKAKIALNRKIRLHANLVFNDFMRGEK